MSDTKNTNIAGDMFTAGVHYGYRKTRRHPSTTPFIFGVKNSVEIFDLEKTIEALSRAQAFVKDIAATGKKVLFVGGKLEARKIIRDAATDADVPFVAGRWVGGTLTNFSLIKTRVEKLEKLISDKEKGELTKYTKKERLLIDREIKRLEEIFGGLRSMKELPAALFVIDPKHEKIAVAEAQTYNIPVIALANSDCDIRGISYPIPGNDGNIKSITIFVTALAQAYKEGALLAPKREYPEAKREYSGSREREEAPKRQYGRGGRSPRDHRPAQRS